MSNATITPTTTEPQSRTKITFDLAAEITPEELSRFEEIASREGRTITEHFKEMALRLPRSITGPAG